MAILKIDLINDAYSRMRISGLTVNPSPEDQQLALYRLESLAYESQKRNICTSYNFEESPDPNSPANIEPYYAEYFALSLSGKLIPDFNKAVPPALERQIAASISSATGFSMMDNRQEVSYPSRMAVGRGNTMKYRPWNRYYNVDRGTPPNNCETNDIYIGDVNDYQESFISYLESGELVDTYTIEVDQGLLLISSSLNLDQNIVSYRVTGVSNVETGGWQQVKITATMDSGRIETRLINFNVIKPETVGGN